MYDALNREFVERSHATGLVKEERNLERIVDWLLFPLCGVCPRGFSPDERKPRMARPGRDPRTYRRRAPRNEFGFVCVAGTNETSAVKLCGRIIMRQSKSVRLHPAATNRVRIPAVLKYFIDEPP